MKDLKIREKNAIGYRIPVTREKQRQLLEGRSKTNKTVICAQEKVIDMEPTEAEYA